jgi:hypothetical protein
MLEFLQKFNNLPIELREKVSAPAVMQSVGEMEKKYGISLATLIMKVMVKDINISDLEKYFTFEYNLAAEQSKQLAIELKKKIFFDVSEHLGFDKDKIENENLDSWLQNRKEETAVRDATYYFSPEDEEEVKDLAKKLAGYNPSLLSADNSIADADKLIKELNISFSSSDLLNRFKQILKTYLKGIRRKIDIRETLIKPVAYGGMEMGEDMAEKILKFADNILASSQPGQAMKQPARISVPEDLTGAVNAGPLAEKNASANSLIRDVDYDFSKLAASPKKESDGVADLPAQKDANNAQPAVNMADEKNEQLKAVNYEEIISKAKRIAQAANINIENDFPIQAKSEKSEAMPDAGRLNVINTRRQKNIDGKVRMDDVKYVPKLMGPVDELREMDLANFRRINSDSAKAAEKIKEKISFLEDESYGQRLKGIKSWRQSPVNRLYLEIGEESIIKKKPINVIIDERIAAGQEYITSEEFIAIMELNKELRY